ncbi:unnamed protein product [Spirodela intermedia]|uniref:EF-hand domain-containing protein n=2 Tax=Spirodela intermedia TaxID=51605 RepID=A0A7I8KBU1_SPIIN|nr:unnamed protein product [Spirodela intermedia]CAA6658878.1 unnamed protein product [Spirodela intermedia]CAA7395161.1 unnamed protein product [Spirodela intermedia]
MAIKQVPCRRSSELTLEEFKDWLKRFDTDKDGRISKQELRRAIRSLGGRYSGWKSGRGVRGADANGNGFIDDAEIENLISFAQRTLGLRIVEF